jgi:hypothetical protein
LPEGNGAGGFRCEICDRWGELEGYFVGGEFPRIKGWLERVHRREANMRALERGGWV